MGLRKIKMKIKDLLNVPDIASNPFLIRQLFHFVLCTVNGSKRHNFHLFDGLNSYTFKPLTPKDVIKRFDELQKPFTVYSCSQEFTITGYCKDIDDNNKIVTTFKNHLKMAICLPDKVFESRHLALGYNNILTWSNSTPNYLTGWTDIINAVICNYDQTFKDELGAFMQFANNSSLQIHFLMKILYRYQGMTVPKWFINFYDINRFCISQQ